LGEFRRIFFSLIILIPFGENIHPSKLLPLDPAGVVAVANFR
jgi:hypothetical protein